MKNNHQWIAGSKFNDRLFPFCWPWTLPNGQQQSIISICNSRKITVTYLVVVCLIPAIMGFASNWNCEPTWELRLLCDQAIWLGNLIEDPFLFLKSLFTAVWIHNGIEHLIFVTVIGFLLVIQSFEMQFGWKLTVVIFMITHLMVGLSFAIIFNIGLNLWPDEAFFTYGFQRNWMGGSVGFYGILGAFVCFHKRGWLLLLTVLFFEMINHFVFGTSIHISMIHLTSICFGTLICRKLLSLGLMYRIMNQT